MLLWGGINPEILGHWVSYLILNRFVIDTYTSQVARNCRHCAL